MNDKELIEKLYAYMNKKHLRIIDAAEALNVKRETISRWRAGKPISKVNRQGIITWTFETENKPIDSPELNIIISIIKDWPAVWQSRALTAIRDVQVEYETLKKHGAAESGLGEFKVG